MAQPGCPESPAEESVDHYAGIGPCIDWTGPTSRGYGRTWANGRTWAVHRLVFFQAHGYLPEVVRHRCDRRGCINVDHLLPGTTYDNIHDCLDRGRANKARGLAHGNAKLSDEQVAEIRRRYPQETMTALAAEYGITQPHVSNIVNRKRRA